MARPTKGISKLPIEPSPHFLSASWEVRFFQICRSVELMDYSSSWDYCPDQNCYVNGYYTDRNCTTGRSDLLTHDLLLFLHAECSD